MEFKNETSLTTERERRLDLIQGDKTRVAIGPVEVAHLDRRLADAWDIRFVEGAESIVDSLAPVRDREAVERFIEAHDDAAVVLSRGAGGSSFSTRSHILKSWAPLLPSVATSSWTGSLSPWA